MDVITFVLLVLAFIFFVGATAIAWKFDRWPGLVAAGLAAWVLVDVLRAGRGL